MKSPVLTTKLILEALSDEWQPITSLIFKLKLKEMYDALPKKRKTNISVNLLFKKTLSRPINI